MKTFGYFFLQMIWTSTLCSIPLFYAYLRYDMVPNRFTICAVLIGGFIAGNLETTDRP